MADRSAKDSIRPTPTLHEHSDLDQSLPEPSAPAFHVLEATLVDDVVVCDAIPLQDSLPVDQNAGSYNQGWCKRHARYVLFGIAMTAVVVTGSTVAILKTTNNQLKVSNKIFLNGKEQDRPIIGNEFENFWGTSVALSADGSILAVGAPGLLGGNSTGYVQLYNMSSGSRWKQIGADIKGNITGDNFGVSVALSADGTTLAVGAYAYTSYDDPNAIPGYVRVYSIIGIGGQIGQDIIGEAPADLSGAFVSLSGDGKTVAIGAHGNDGNGAASGHVRVYQMRNSESNWMQLGQDIDGEAEYDLSGWAVSLSADGKTVAIGSPYLNDDVDWSYGQVRVYYFDDSASSWVQQGLDIVGDLSGDEFGSSVALSADGDILAIGAPTYLEAVSPGYVKVYHLQDDGWKQMGNTIKATADKGYFGYSISLSEDGKTVAVGDYYTNENGADGGSVSVYQFDDASLIWIQHGKINGEDTLDWFGTAVSLSADGNMVAVGSPQSGENRGNVRVFKVDD